MSEKSAPFTDPNETDTRDRTITARWNLDVPDTEGWQRQGVLSVTHYVRRGYRATASYCEVRRESGGMTEKLGMCQYAVVLDVPTRTRYSAQQLTRVYTDALRELRSRLEAGDVDLAAFFPQHG